MKIAVLMGGNSYERDISIESGTAVMVALDEMGYEVTGFDPIGGLVDLVNGLDEYEPDCVFNALHGVEGEDGRIQGLMDMMGLSYTHSGVRASAIAMHKPTCKRIAEKEGILCPKDKIVTQEELEKQDPFTRPYVLKPTEEGSSISVQIIKDDDTPKITDVETMAEPYINGRELTVSVMGDRALGVTELVSKNAFYDFDAKYHEGITEHILPAKVDEQVSESAEKSAIIMHQALGCRGVSRSDFRLDEKGDLYFLELNTQPGLTGLSLLPEQAKAKGISFNDLIEWMIKEVSCQSKH